MIPITAGYFHYDPLGLSVGASWKSAVCPVIKSSNDPNSDTGARLARSPQIGGRGDDDEDEKEDNDSVNDDDPNSDTGGCVLGPQMAAK